MRRPVPAFVCALAATFALVAAPAFAAPVPLVTTTGPTAVTASSATLNGTVNPQGQSTTYYFQYGTTRSYGSQTATAAAGSGTAVVNESAAIASLAPDTGYQYRLVATNRSGTTYGNDYSFTTAAPPVPVVTVRFARKITTHSATLAGAVNPNGQATSYFFQYGTTTGYGSQTATASAGSGTAPRLVTAAIGALNAGTTYHFRLVATNASGTVRGADAAFTTGSRAVVVTLAASPSPTTFGRSTKLKGRVRLPRPSSVAPSQVSVTLQSAPSLSGPWVDAATTTPSGTGVYSFQTAPAANTYYRALAGGTTSAPVLVLVRFRVGVAVSSRHPLRGSLVRFHGRVAPGHGGVRVLVQRLGPHGRWHTIRRTRLRRPRGGVSIYSVRVRMQRGGRYRVVVRPDTENTQGVSQTVRIRVR